MFSHQIGLSSTCVVTIDCGTHRVLLSQVISTEGSKSVQHYKPNRFVEYLRCCHRLRNSSSFALTGNKHRGFQIYSKIRFYTFCLGCLFSLFYVPLYKLVGRRPRLVSLSAGPIGISSPRHMKAFGYQEPKSLEAFGHQGLKIQISFCFLFCFCPMAQRYLSLPNPPLLLLQRIPPNLVNLDG